MRMLRNCTGILGGALILPLALSAQTFTTLYNFGTQAYGAAGVLGGVILGPQGVLYGIAGGGRWNLGTVYELLPPSSPAGAWTEVVLHSFSGRQVIPQGGLAIGPNGSLYGFAESITGGTMAFQLDPPTGASIDWAYRVIYQFTEADGNPKCPLVFGSPLGYGQSLYGVATHVAGNDTVYRLTPPPMAGGAWTNTTLYTFPGGSKGSGVAGSLAVGTGGALFGVANGGYIEEMCATNGGCGTVFSLTPPGVPGGPWTEQVLYSFNPAIGDGYLPNLGVLIGTGGVLYGTTTEAANGGTVYSLTPPVAPEEPMTATLLHAFTGRGGDGNDPNTILVLGSDGALHGTTQYGGASNDGTVFELAPPASPGGSWTETILHSFTSFEIEPQGLTLAPGGTIYGTTYTGGSLNEGTLFAVTP